MTATINNSSVLLSGAAALLFAATFMFGGQFRPFGRLITDQRSLISFAAGSSAAYVFVHLMPELDEVRHTFLESVKFSIHLEGEAIYFIALIGFLFFYGLQHLRTRFAGGDKGDLDFKIHVGGFAAYVWLVSYLLANQLKESADSILLYSIAMALHFLSIDYALREEHDRNYQTKGRRLLAGMAIFGWGTGVLFALSDGFMAALTAFISGAIIMNSAVSELPQQKDGRFMPFLLGGVIYALILLPL
ncbi:hypothetical protein [Marinobacter sp. 2_MG-2023]|uniref:hypothetical protein n=1 Tax=Marinobacter sp. 2_MG-2023 TaxID=3062679 RepID=UPI0026E1E797|nr:hypothetical protein [Marinobacter sp. 2_MG-2023]MDO6443614.1 hypothetical protein [Marinobacter sp. 2_MG-2023]